MAELSTLMAISPIDGRYRRKTEKLAQHMSEFGLIKSRVIVEVNYLDFLSQKKIIRPLTQEERAALYAIPNMDLAGAQLVKDIETKGVPAEKTNGLGEIKKTNHDVKSVEYYVKIMMNLTSMKDLLEYVHLAPTSEDVTNTAYGIMICDTVNRVMLPSMETLWGNIHTLAVDNANLPMLARTHGQPASPTTVGKEFAVFSERMRRQIAQLQAFRILVKLNGATGNYNAHMIAYPLIDWRQFSRDFIMHLDKQYNADGPMRMTPNLVTTQVESHDTYAELFAIFQRFNTILIGFDQDMWRYISDDWIKQKPKEGEVGSSTMPHKVNPIDFENSEGNCSMSNALFGFFSSYLPIERLQRHLSDSTIERCFGTAFAHSLVAYESTIAGLGKININEDKIGQVLADHPEVIAEAIQTVLRREGAMRPYEQLSKLTRGKPVTTNELTEFINSLDISEELRDELLAITPQNYTGIAADIAKHR